MTEIGKLISDELLNIIKDESIELTKNVTIEIKDLTPVDTGHAMSNWIPTIGKPNEKIIGSKQDVSEVEYKKSMDELNGYELNKGNLYLTNNVEYIELLNEGHSSQAPRAFVQIGISRGMDKTGGWD